MKVTCGGVARPKCNNAVLYDGKQCAAESPSRGCILDKTYVSHLGHWETAQSLWVAMLGKRFAGGPVGRRARQPY